MGTISDEPLYWDPYKPELFHDPYPVFRRMREEAPLYYNAEHGFYALSRFTDVEQGLRDRETYSSARGGILEIIKANLALPDAVFIFQDPPVHTAYRSIVQRAITPKRMSAIEEKVRRLTAHYLDPLVGADQMDFIADLGAKVPMRVIGMLLGIPEEDQEATRERVDARIRTEPGKPKEFTVSDNFEGAEFADYIDWRTKHPSDDMMTEMLHTEFKDPTGTVRKLTRDEILNLVNLIAGAGNETTNRLIGWAGKLLAEHPDQRRDLVNDPTLMPRAIEELVRFQPPGPAIGRYTTKEVTCYGKTLPAGSIMMLMVGSANRDERRFKNGDNFDIHRERLPHLGFGHGIHVCVGAVLARLEGRVVLEEVLKRFPEWHVDYEHAEMAPTSTVRGWETLPVFLGSAPKRKRPAAAKATPEATPVEEAVPFEGTWNLVVKGPTGPQPTVLVIERSGDTYTGTQSGQGNTTAVSDVAVQGNSVSWTNHVTKPIKLTVKFSGEIVGRTMSGKAKTGLMGSYPFTAEKA